jgi:hypothetical protein
VNLKNLQAQTDNQLLMSYKERFPKSLFPAWDDPSQLPPWYRSELVQALLTNSPSQALEEQALSQHRQRQAGAVY